MRFDSVLASALYSSALFLGQVYADELDASDSSPTSLAGSSASSPVEKPTFTVSIRVEQTVELAPFRLPTGILLLTT